MEKQELEKINSVFSNRTYNLFDLRSENDRDILEALKELSRFYPKNSSVNRRNLRSVIEGRSIAINQQFLDGFKRMEGSLSVVYKNMAQMNETLTEMRRNLSLTKKNTQTLIDKTMNLQKDIKTVSAKQQIASIILGNGTGFYCRFYHLRKVVNHLIPIPNLHGNLSKKIQFQLNPAELSSLRAVTMDPDMFIALNKSQDILNNCKSLMQIGWQVTAQDVIEQMTLYQEAGMERLFRWTQGRCRNIEMRDPYDLLPRAMAKLQDRPILFKQILEEYSINRRDILVRQFIEALTGSSRGIELRATEPKRYVGDMLAWLHQAIPCEKDNLIFLLKNCESTDEAIQQTLGSINEGVCHPLKVRIEHVLFNEDNSKDCILLHGIFYLLRYYKTTLSHIVENGQLNATLNELVEMAEKTFLQSLQNRITHLLAIESINPPTDLLPIQASHKILALLGQLLSMDTSVESKKNFVDQMVSYAVDPLIMHITESASKLDAVEMSVYLLNNFHFIEMSLTLYPFLEARLEQLKAQCDAQMDTLTSEQASTLVTHLNLGTIYTILQSKPSKPLSVVHGMEPASIANFYTQLEVLLATPDFYQLPQLTLLASTNHRMGILKRAASVISSIYSDLYGCVRDPENSYPQPEKLLPLPPEVVAQGLTNAF